MSARGVTTGRILRYLHDGAEQRRVGQICRYMWEQYETQGCTTRSQLWRLAQDGVIERPARGYYRIIRNHPLTGEPL